MYPELSDNENQQETTVFRDVIMLALAGFVSLVILLLPFINEPTDKTEDRADPPGNVIIEAFWPENRDVDLDLWVQAPEDIPVGYSNRGGIYFNLLRDDLGNYKDTTPINYEVAFSRGINPGEHIVNIHLYRDDNMAFEPFLAKVVVTIVDPETKIRNQILESDVLVSELGEEITVFRFKLDDKGTLDQSSINNNYIQLRSGQK